MEFRVLGPLEVVDGARVVALGGPRLRSLLAWLLVHATAVVPSERLREELWGNGSAGRANLLQFSVSRLRKALGSADRIVTLAYAEGSGYVIEHTEALMILAEVLHRTGRRSEATTVLEEAIALCERKGNVVSAAQARALLDALPTQ